MSLKSQSCVLCKKVIGTEETSTDIFSRLACDSQTIIVNKLSSVLECSAEFVSKSGSSLCSSCLQRISSLHLLEIQAEREKLAIRRLFSHHNDDVINQCSVNTTVLESGVRLQWPAIDQSDAVTSQSANDVTTEGSTQRQFVLGTGAGSSVLKRRKRQTDTSRRYQCKVCDQRFVAYSHRVEHMLTHLGETPWLCELCQHRFRTKSALTAHTRRIHQKENGVIPRAVRDDEDKGNEDGGVRTVSTVSSRLSSIERKRLTCDQCGRKFRRRHHLTLHVRQHSGERPFTCGVCAARFVNRSRLNRHALVHAEKRHACTSCLRRFRRGYDLRRHVAECCAQQQQQVGVASVTAAATANVAPPAVASLTLVQTTAENNVSTAAALMLSTDHQHHQQVFYQLPAGSLCVSAEAGASERQDSAPAVIAGDSPLPASVLIDDETISEQLLTSSLQLSRHEDLQPVLVSVASELSSSVSVAAGESGELLGVPCVLPSLQVVQTQSSDVPYEPFSSR